MTILDHIKGPSLLSTIWISTGPFPRRDEAPALFSNVWIKISAVCRQLESLFIPPPFTQPFFLFTYSSLPRHSLSPPALFCPPHISIFRYFLPFLSFIPRVSRYAICSFFIPAPLCPLCEELNSRGPREDCRGTIRASRDLFLREFSMVPLHQLWITVCLNVTTSSGKTRIHRGVKHSFARGMLWTFHACVCKATDT